MKLSGFLVISAMFVSGIAQANGEIYGWYMQCHSQDNVVKLAVYQSDDDITLDVKGTLDLEKYGWNKYSFMVNSYQPLTSTLVFDNSPSVKTADAIASLIAYRALSIKQSDSELLPGTLFVGGSSITLSCELRLADTEEAGALDLFKWASSYTE